MAFLAFTTFWMGKIGFKVSGWGPEFCGFYREIPIKSEKIGFFRSAQMRVKFGFSGLFEVLNRVLTALLALEKFWMGMVGFEVSWLGPEISGFYREIPIKSGKFYFSESDPKGSK